MSEAWEQYAADFSAMSDKEIEYECEQCRNQVDEAESWLDAVAAWEAAGKPRGAGTNQDTTHVDG